MFQIEVADLIICIENRFDYVRELCNEYITAKQCCADLIISVSAQELRQETEKTADSFISDEQAEKLIENAPQQDMEKALDIISGDNEWIDDDLLAAGPIKKNSKKKSNDKQI